MRRLRSGVLIVVLAAGMTACGFENAAKPAASTKPVDDVASTTSTSSTTTTTTTIATATATTTVPDPTVYVADPLEVDGQLKEAAANFVQALGSYDRGKTGVDAAKSRLAGLGADPALAETVPDLFAADAATLQIIYPQLGGLGGGAASVIVLAEQHIVQREATEVRTMAIDVRLTQVDGAWKVTDVEPDRARKPTGGSAPSPLAEEALASPQLILTDTARRDLSSGIVDDRLLELVLDLAQRHSLSITAFAGGHPYEVFGKGSISNHTRGRGVDIWAVDGGRVLDSTNESPARVVAQEALDLGSTEIGSPWDLDGPGGPSFTNELHQDHLHLAFDGVG